MRLEWVSLVEAEVELPAGGASPMRGVVGALIRRSGSSGCEVQEEEEEALVLHDHHDRECHVQPLESSFLVNLALLILMANGMTKKPLLW